MAVSTKSKISSNLELLTGSWQVLPVIGVQLNQKYITEVWKNFKITFDASKSFYSSATSCDQQKLFMEKGKYTMIEDNIIIFSNGIEMKIREITDISLRLITMNSYGHPALSDLRHPVKFDFFPLP